jgi:hypothetical protein
VWPERVKVKQPKILKRRGVRCEIVRTISRNQKKGKEAKKEKDRFSQTASVF